MTSPKRKAREHEGDPLFDLAGHAKRIRVALAEDDLSYRTAAPMLRVSVATLHRYARARGMPDVETYLRVEKWLADRGAA